jgi:hypothetical protein
MEVPESGPWWNAIVKAAITCSTPSKSNSKCITDIESAKVASIGMRELILEIGNHMDGIPSFRDWMKKHFLSA